MQRHFPNPPGRLYLREECPLAHKTLGESAIWKEFGLSVVAAKRGEELFSNMDGTFRLLPEDYIALVGAHEQNQRFLKEFAPPRQEW